MIRQGENGQLVLDLAQGNGASPDVDQARAVALLRDRGPSTRDSTSKWVDWAALGDQLGQPFDNLHIPLSKLEQMRRDPMIAFGLMFRKVPLIRAKWYIKCSDARVAAAVDAALRPIYGRAILAMANDMDFGYSPIITPYELGELEGTWIDPSDTMDPEKPIWSGNVQPVVWKAFKALNPRKTWPAWTDAGEFNGIYTQRPSGDFEFGKNNKPPDIPLGMSLWSTNEKDSVFGSLYGYPTVGYAYRYWWSYWYRWALSDRAFERYADPAIVVYHPPDGIDDETGEEVKYSEQGLAAGEDVRSGSTVAVPNSIIRDLEDRNTGMRQWEIKPMEGTAAFDAMNTSFEYMDSLKLRALLVPEQALIEGKGGTSSRNVAGTLGDTLYESLAVKKAEYDAQLNRFLIKRFVELNFGPDAPSAEIVTRGFETEDIDTMRTLLTQLANTRPDDVPVDLHEILDRLGIPTISPGVQAKRLAEATQQAQAILPPETPSQNGVQQQPTAAVNASGQYVQPREVIHLAQRWPKSKHFTDSDVRRAADEIASIWEDEYTALYDDFAKFVARQKAPLLLAEGDEKFKAAARNLVNAWKPPLEKLAKAAESTEVVIRRVLGIAADRELTTFGLSSINWSMDNPEVRDWMQAHGAKLVRRISDTVKGELRTFLAQEMKKPLAPPQLASSVRDHFSEWPGWKADRVARSEVRDAYNAGALLGYQSAGVAQVQALDGTGGLHGHTDPECLERNGKVFAVQDALAQEEHPNGTLAWRPLVTVNFGVSILEQGELPDPDSVGWYDSSTETLYLAEGLNAEERREQLLLVGSRLERKE